MSIDKQISDLLNDLSDPNNNKQLDLDFDFSNTPTIGYGQAAQPALTISSLGEDTITLGSNTLTGAIGSGAGQYTYGSGTYDYNNIMWGGGSSVPTITIAPNTATPGTILTTGITNGTFNWQDESQKSSLQVRGDANFEGDVKIKGKSLVDMLEKIEEKLAILRPNEQLEEKWDELRELRNRYKELEKEIIEKEKMWDILKK